MVWPLIAPDGGMPMHCINREICCSFYCIFIGSSITQLTFLLTCNWFRWRTPATCNLNASIVKMRDYRPTNTVWANFIWFYIRLARRLSISNHEHTHTHIGTRSWRQHQMMANKNLSHHRAEPYTIKSEYTQWMKVLAFGFCRAYAMAFSSEEKEENRS